MEEVEYNTAYEPVKVVESEEKTLDSNEKAKGTLEKPV